ncbi:hypothetical protein D3C79_676830 [compost metagenome]
MAHAHLPQLTLVHRRCTPELHALGVHRCAQQRHVVFPAHRSADTPGTAFDHRQGRAVATAPDQPLGTGGHQLAVHRHQALLGLEEQHAAIQGMAATLDHPEHQAGAGTRRQPSEGLGLAAGYVDGIGEIAGEGFAAFGQAVAQARTEGLALGITAQQRFGHHHQAGARVTDGLLVRKDLLQGMGFAFRR